MIRCLCTAVMLSFFSATIIADEITSGTIRVGGNLNFDNFSGTSKSNVSDTYKTSSRELGAEVAYYIFDNVGVGIMVEKEAASDTSGGLKSESDWFVIAPTLSLSLSITESVNLNLSGMTGKLTSTYTLDGVAETSDGYVWGAGAGFSYFLKSNLSLDVSSHYMKVSADSPDGSATVTISGISTVAGFSLYF